MKRLILTTALALFAAPALAETKSQWGCEWQQADNGNYWFRTDASCPYWKALGMSKPGEGPKPILVSDDDNDGEEPGDGGDEGEGPGGETEGPGDGGGTDPGEGPGDGGNEGPGAGENPGHGGHHGGHGKGKGKGKGKGGRG